MKKLAVLYSGDSRGLNGAALYVDRFRRFSKEFESAGIEPIICDSRTIGSNNAKNDREVIDTETDYANSWKHRIKNKIKKVLSGTYTGSKIFIRLAWELPGEKSITLNKSEIISCDAVLANDMHCAYQVLQHFPDKDLFFVMHNSGILLKMLLDRLPAIRGKKKEAELKSKEQEIFNKAKAVLFVSRKARDTFAEEYPQHKQKAYYVPEGIEDIDEVPNLNCETVRLICVGTVCDRKNQLELVKAFEKYKRTEIDLTIVGGGPSLEECRNYANQNDIKNIAFTGSVKNTEVPDYLKKSNVFILASKDEGLPAVGIEALRSGLPILVTNVGGCAELIHDNGRIIGGTDQKSIQDAIDYIIMHKEFLEKLSHNSRALFEKEYSIAAMVASYKKILVDEIYGE